MLLRVLIDGSAPTNTKHITSELNVSLVTVMRFTRCVGIAVSYIAKTVGIKIPCHVSVESLLTLSTLLQFKNIHTLMLTNF